MNKTYQHVCLSAAYMLAAFKNNEKYNVSIYNFWKHSPYIKEIIG